MMFVLQMLNYKNNEKEKNEFSDFLKFILYYCTSKAFKSSGGVDLFTKVSKVLANSNFTPPVLIASKCLYHN